MSKTLAVEEIERALCHFIKQSIVDGKIDVEPDTSFSSLRIDSLSIVELMLFLERQFQIIIPETEMLPQNFQSVKTLAACAHRCQNNG